MLESRVQPTISQVHFPIDTIVKGNRNNKKMQVGGRVFCLEAMNETKDLSAILIGTLLINHLYAHVLLN